MKKIISAITLGVIFVVTFAAGVGCIVKGAGDFSWDKVNEYVSLTDMVMINDEPISELFGFSDHSALVESYAEGRIECPTNGGEIKIKDIPAKTIVTVSEDEYIHITFSGEIRKSGVVSSAENLTGTNIPNMEFKYNKSKNEATIRFKKLRTNKSTPQLTIAIPASFNGELDISNVAGKIEGDISLDLTELSIDDVAGKVMIGGISAEECEVKNIAGDVDISDGDFGYFKASDAAGKITVAGSVGYFEIKDIMGNVTVDSDRNITGNCVISDIMGNVKINLPSGSEINVVRSDVMGKVEAANSSASAQYTVKVSDIMGKVTINN